LGVIFWPIIFVQPEDVLVQERNIPPQPDISTERVEAPDSVGLRGSPTSVAEQERARAEEALSSEAELEADQAEGLERTVDTQDPVISAPAVSKPAPQPKAEPVKTSPEELKLDADGVPVAWILQVVSVSAADKAEELRKRLDAMGHKAYVEKIPSGGKSLYRVYVGPKFERGELEAIKSQVDAEFGVSSMTRRYVP
jgi:DedD protein